MSGSDPLVADLLDVVHGVPLKDGDGVREDSEAYRQRRLCPAPLVAFASWVGPF